MQSSDGLGSFSRLASLDQVDRRGRDEKKSGDGDNREDPSGETSYVSKEAVDLSADENSLDSENQSPGEPIYCTHATK